MKISSGFRSVAVAVIAAAGVGLASAAHADSGTIRFAVYKAAFFVGNRHVSDQPLDQGGFPHLFLGGKGIADLLVAFEQRVHRFRSWVDQAHEQRIGRTDVPSGKWQRMARETWRAF